MARRALYLSIIKPPTFQLHSRRQNSSQSGTFEAKVLEIKKLEEAIQMVFVKRSMPDWLVFIPGSSFWVPPRERPVDLVDLMQKLMNPPSKEEPMVLESGNGGWPSFELLTQKDDAAQLAVDLEEESIKVTKESGSGDSER